MSTHDPRGEFLERADLAKTIGSLARELGMDGVDEADLVRLPTCLLRPLWANLLKRRQARAVPAGPRRPA